MTAEVPPAPRTPPPKNPAKTKRTRTMLILGAAAAVVVVALFMKSKAGASTAATGTAATVGTSPGVSYLNSLPDMTGGGDVGSPTSAGTPTRGTAPATPATATPNTNVAGVTGTESQATYSPTDVATAISSGDVVDESGHYSQTAAVGAVQRVTTKSGATITAVNEGNGVTTYPNTPTVRAAEGKTP